MLIIERPRRGVDDHALEREVLRMLWHVHFASTAQLTRLVVGAAAVQHRARLRPTLTRLYATDQVWREARRLLPGYRSHAGGAVSGGYYWGLTERGRRIIMERLPDLSALRCLTREGYMSAAERRTILHSGHYTEWCTNLIETLRFHRRCRGVFLETESTRLGAHLRMDGLIRFRLLETNPPESEEQSDEYVRPWDVPWMELRAAPIGGTVDVTLALEIDEGTEQLDTITRKALNYRRTYVGGFQDRSNNVESGSIAAVPWADVLCPMSGGSTPALRRMAFPIPVFVVPGTKRLYNVFAAWQQGWNGSEVRMTSWRDLQGRPSVIAAPYLNQHGKWVDLLGHELALDVVVPSRDGGTDGAVR